MSDGDQVGRDVLWRLCARRRADMQATSRLEMDAHKVAFRDSRGVVRCALHLGFGRRMTRTPLGYR